MRKEPFNWKEKKLNEDLKLFENRQENLFGLLVFTLSEVLK